MGVGSSVLELATGTGTGTRGGIVEVGAGVRSLLFFDLDFFLGNEIRGRGSSVDVICMRNDPGLIGMRALISLFGKVSDATGCRVPGGDGKADGVVVGVDPGGSIDTGSSCSGPDGPGVLVLGSSPTLTEVPFVCQLLRIEMNKGSELTT